MSAINVINAAFLSDGYKTEHHKMFPEGTRKVYINFTPRDNKHAPYADKVVVFGIQMVMRQIHELFNNNFFHQPKKIVINEIKEELSMYLGTDYDTAHFEALHDLGYLPIQVKALNEGELCPIKVPILTIINTHDSFFWLPNYLETILSNLLWKPITSATIAYTYRQILNEWCLKTDKDNMSFVDYQGHDFSMRGMSGIDASVSSGLGHLTSFFGTDSLTTLWGARKYYDVHGFVGCSVPATEHSVMCAGTKDNEIETFRRLLRIYPKGILSVVSDTWDLWRVCTEYLSILKEEILNRNGKLVIRPDSGDPADVVCGKSNNIIRLKDTNSLKDSAIDIILETVSEETAHGEMGDSERTMRFYHKNRYYDITIDNLFWNRYDKQYYHLDMSFTKPNVIIKEIQLMPEDKGVIQLLWDIFGGTINSQGYKVLDSHIGCIYGDSINLERADNISKRLAENGFASTNIVYGIGLTQWPL